MGSVFSSPLQRGTTVYHHDKTTVDFVGVELGSANYNVTDSVMFLFICHLDFACRSFVIYTLIPTVRPLNSCDQPYSWHILIPQFSYVRIRLWPNGTCMF